MALRCAECGKDNLLGTFYCGRCAAGLIPEAMIPPAARRASHSAGEGGAPAATEAPPVEARVETLVLPPPVTPPASVAGRGHPAAEGERRYRIILGDTCPVCRMVSRITFTPDRAPQIPIAGCRGRGGCRCSLPIFADELHAALSASEPSLNALAPDRLTTTPPAAPSPADIAPAPLIERSRPSAVQRAPAEREAPEEQRPASFGSAWSLPSPITQQRRRVLHELTDLYYQRRIQGIKIVTTADCCRVCAEVGASIYEPSVAPTLPIVGCWDGWQCRCMYSEEALPLDHRGLQAMERLQQLERDRELRRRRVARGGARPLHRAAAVLALGAVAGAVLGWFGEGQSPVVTAVLALILAGAVVVSAVGALRRWQRLPAPGWAYLLCGGGLAGIGLHSLVGVGAPASGWLTDPSRLEKIHLALQPGGFSVQTLGLGQQIIALAGVAMFILGLITLALVGRYERNVQRMRRGSR